MTTSTSETAVGVAAPTRERILQAAGALFASRGYTGTSTREVAAVVGIRQPSLFHHFPSKAAIAEELLELSLGRVAEPVSALADDDESPAARLYGYVYFDTRYLATSRYNLAGLYADDLLLASEFGRWRERRAALHDAIEQMIAQGIAREELIVADTEFARRAISSLNLITIEMHHGRSLSWASQFADDVATYALRGLLSALSELPRVRRDGVQIGEELAGRVTDRGTEGREPSPAPRSAQRRAQAASARNS